MIKNFVGGIVVASANPRFCGFGTRIAVIHRRLQKYVYQRTKVLRTITKPSMALQRVLTEFM